MNDAVNIGALVVPMRCYLCDVLLSLFDTGNARVAGLQKDFKLTDNQYQICITVLYVYVCVQIVFQVLKKILLGHISLQTCLRAYCYVK